MDCEICGLKTTNEWRFQVGLEYERARILALCEHYNIGPGHRLVKAIVSGEDVRDE